MWVAWVLAAGVAAAAPRQEEALPGAEAESPFAARAAWSATTRGAKAVNDPDDSRMIGGRDAMAPVWTGLRPPFDVMAALKAARARRLAAVVAVERDGRHWCTGTVVADGTGQRGLLLAGHCAFEVGGLPVEAVEVAGERVAVADGWVESDFGACVADGGQMADCMQKEGARDLMVLPVPAALDGVQPWAVCPKARQVDDDRVAYGYGQDAQGRVGALRAGTFGPDALRGDDRWAAATEALVAAGDSGGPVVSPDDDAKLGERTPTVCWVISGFLDATGGMLRSPGPRTVATRFERAWDLPPLPSGPGAGASDTPSEDVPDPLPGWPKPALPVPGWHDYGWPKPVLGGGRKPVIEERPDR